MRCLIACEFSQTVCRAFREKGHDAWSCDLLDTEGDPSYHIKGNVLDHLNDGWNLMVAHPSCTFLANSGSRWLYNDDGSVNFERWINMATACEFFRKLLEAPIEKICIENPIPHKYALASIGRKYDQIVHPWMFGNEYSKVTCLWLKNLPKLIPTNIVDGRDDRIHKCSPGPNRWKIRSRTPEGLGKAMAEQWG